MLQTILDERQAKLLKEEKHLLEELRLILTRFEADSEDMDTVRRSLLQLDELFLLVVVGEFNSGKSAFINALLGQRFLPEGVTPTTSQINILKYGAQPGQELQEEFVLLLTCPVEFLREINIVDTPGTNAIIRRHEEITHDFVPRSDLVLFVTSADRPFTESEREFMERIRQWGKKVVIVLNKIDIVDEEDNQDGVAQVVTFIADNARALLGFAPEIFPISAKLALRAKSSAEGETKDRLWAASRFADLERYILGTLDQASRIQLKLMNPLGIAEQVIGTYQSAVENRLSLLKDDFVTLDNIEAQLAVYKEDMRREFRYRLSDVENVLYEMESRGLEFFDDHLRLVRVFDLINVERIRGAYERQVVADVPRQLEATVQELIDWLVESDLRQWQAVMTYLNRRQATERHKDKIIGEIGGAFEYNRKALLASVGRAAQEVVNSYDKTAEAQELAESVRIAVAETALLQAGAVGLGTILTIILTSTAADLTGILAAGAIAALGLFVIPSKRRQAKRELRDKIEDMRQRLSEALTTQFERELDLSVKRIEQAVAPYTRFIRAEREKLERSQGELAEVDEAMCLLKGQVDNLIE